MNATDNTPRYEVECQDATKTGVRHEATYSHVNEYGQKIYNVVCDCDESGTWYDERYTDEVVYEVGTVQYGNTPEDLDLTPAVEATPAPVYVDPYPGRKGTDRIYWTCGKCAGAGSVSWGVDANAAVRNPDGSVRIVGKACFDCHGTGQGSHLVSSARSTARRQVKEAIKRAADAARFIAEHEAREAQEAADLATATAEYTAAHPDVVAALPTTPGEFGESVREQFAATGSLSDGQAAAVVRIAAETASDPAPAPVVAGKGAVTGRIVSVKWVDGYGYGSSVRKMTVLDDRGFKVYGTAPVALDGAERGDRVTFTATLEASKDDEAFGFFKRPTKASIVD